MYSWKEIAQEPGYQDLYSGTNHQAAPDGMDEEPMSSQLTEDSPKDTSPSTG